MSKWEFTVVKFSMPQLLIYWFKTSIYHWNIYLSGTTSNVIHVYCGKYNFTSRIWCMCRLLHIYKFQFYSCRCWYIQKYCTLPETCQQEVLTQQPVSLAQSPERKKNMVDKYRSWSYVQSYYIQIHVHYIHVSS